MTLVGPHPTDVHVGARLRRFRRDKGVSQTDLAEALGLTFQQVQKYESGANRISASKLLDAARFLGVRISAFFEGLEGSVAGASAADGDAEADVASVARDFAALSPPLRKQVAGLLAALSQG